MPEQLTTVLSGSFKYKPEIDKVNNTFTELGVDVLEPAKGWLMLPPKFITGDWRPLPGPEEHLASIVEIEKRFIRALSRSSFVYICNFDGYIGTSTGLEIGYALGWQKPMFSIEPFKTTDELGDSLEYVASFIEHASPEDVVEIIRAQSSS